MSSTPFCCFSVSASFSSCLDFTFLSDAFPHIPRLFWISWATVVKYEARLILLMNVDYVHSDSSLQVCYFNCIQYNDDAKTNNRVSVLHAYFKPRKSPPVWEYTSILRRKFTVSNLLTFSLFWRSVRCSILVRAPLSLGAAYCCKFPNYQITSSN